MGKARLSSLAAWREARDQIISGLTGRAEPCPAHGGSACPHGRPHPSGHRSSSALPRAWSSPETHCPTHLLARGNTGKGHCHRSRGWMPILHLGHGARVPSSPSAAGERGSASPELTSRETAQDKCDDFHSSSVHEITGGCCDQRHRSR